MPSVQLTEDSDLGVKGQIVQVDPEQAIEGWRAGKFRVPEGIPQHVVDTETGSVGEIDAPDVARILHDPEASQRFRFAGGEEVSEAFSRKRVAEVADPFTAGAAGFLRGATLGASDKILGTDPRLQEVLRVQQELHPTASMTGEIAGTILPAVVPGGQFTPAGALARGAGAIGRGVGGVAARGLGTGVLGGAVARGIGMGAEGAIEGAVIEAGRVLSEDALGEADITAERLMGALGGGAFIGGAGGFVLGGAVPLIGQGLKAGVRGGKNAVKSMWKRFHGTEMDDVVASSYAKVAGKLVGEENEAFIRETLSRTEGGQKMIRILNQGDELIESSIPKIRTTLDADDALTRRMQDFAVGNLKRSGIRRVVRADNLDQAAGEADTLMQRVLELADDIDARPALYPGTGGARKQLRQIANEFSDQLADGLQRGGKDGAADLFIAMDRAKRSIGRLASRASRGDSGVAETFDNLYHAFRNHLELEDLYGGAARVQKEVNAAWSPYIANGKRFRQRFMAKSGQQDGFFDIYTADPAKLNTYLRNVGKETAKLDDEVFRRHVALRTRLNETIAKHYDVPDDLRDALQLSKKNVADMESQLATIDDSITKLNKWRELREAEASFGDLTGALPIGGAVLGGPLGGIAGLAATALSRPSRLIRLRMAAQQLTDRMALRMGPGAKDWVRKGTHKAAHLAKEVEETGHRFERALHTAQEGARTTQESRAARRGIRKALNAARLGVTKVSAEEYNRTTSAVLEHVANPEGVKERLAEQTKDLAEAAPKVAGQFALKTQLAAEFLRTKIPAATLQRSGLQPHFDRSLPSETEMAKFLRYARAVDDPASVVEDLENGDLTPEAVEALRTVYPRMYQDMVHNVMEAVSELRDPLEFDAKLQLGQLLGIVTDPSLEPRFVATMQQLSQSTGAGITPGETTTAQAPDIASDQMSESQRLAQRNL